MIRLFRPYCTSIALVCLLATLTSCNILDAVNGTLPPGMAFLGDCEEKTYSEILQRQQRVLLEIELVDTVRPPHFLYLDALDGYAVPAGNHRVQFRILLPSVSWNDSRDREARGFFDVELVAGHRYRVAGIYSKKPHTFQLLDMTTNQPVSPAIDLGFFGPVELDLQCVPIVVIPRKH